MWVLFINKVNFKLAAVINAQKKLLAGITEENLTNLEIPIEPV